MSESNQVLLLHEDEDLRQLLEEGLRNAGYQVTSTTSSEEALNRLNNFRVAVLGLYSLSDDISQDKRREKGIAVLRDICKTHCKTKVIVVTQGAEDDSAIADLELEVNYLREGIWLGTHIVPTVTEAFQSENNAEESLGKLPKIVGESRLMKEVHQHIKRVAHTGTTVLIRGETGSGKELIAQAIRYRSLRRAKPFIVVSCDKSDDVIESELFGHVKGAFTGATDKRKGLFEEADGGTIFLDEVGDLSIKVQTKLLRIIQEKEITHVGTHQAKRVDVRIIAATHRDLRAAIVDRNFREDLFYRLNRFEILVPPLRDRKDDIPLLAQHFVEKYCESEKIPCPQISDDALDILCDHDYPGNVRELEGTIEAAVVLTDGYTIKPEAIRIKKGETADPMECLRKSIVQTKLTHDQLTTVYVKEFHRVTGSNKTAVGRIAGGKRPKSSEWVRKWLDKKIEIEGSEEC